MSHPGHDRLLKWRFNAQPILRGIALVGSVFSWRDQNRYMPQQPEEQTRRALCDATGSSSVSTVSTIYEERERERDVRMPNSAYMRASDSKPEASKGQSTLPQQGPMRPCSRIMGRQLMATSVGPMW